MIRFRSTLTIACVLLVVAGASEAQKTGIEKVYDVLSLERVVDGDTIIASGRKIRLWGIDAPEKNEPHYLAAKLMLESLLDDGTLTCKFIEKDRYERDVMHCLVDHSDLGSMLVQVGVAKDYKRYSGGYYQHEQAIAQSKNLGVWKD